ncbi:MAG: IS630 family transposase [Gemmatimonadetes bacterium]|jgi:transposase|nr:IS630 family transposase [Gemmatimonadota bacterium]
MEKDARSLPAEAQENLRRRAIRAILSGAKQTEVARILGVTRQAVAGWVRAHRSGGAEALKTKRQGRPPGKRLQPWQSAHVLKDLIRHLPDELGLDDLLWTRDSVAQLVRKKFGIRLSRWTVRRYLRFWGLLVLRPRRRLFAVDNSPGSDWWEKEYPQIRRWARREKARVNWYIASSFGAEREQQQPAGQIPAGEVTGVVTNRGKWCFMVTKGKLSAEELRYFLDRLVRHSGRKIFLIVPRDPVFDIPSTEEWLAENAARIRLFSLPEESKAAPAREEAG